MRHTPHSSTRPKRDTVVAWYRAALLRLVGGMVAALAGRGADVPRSVRLRILRVLLPAEAAGRRLIFMLAQGVTAPARPRGPVGVIGPGAAAKAVPAFALFDRRKSFPELAQKRAVRGDGPRISYCDEERGAAAPVAAPRENGAGLNRRLLALQAALEDLPKQARRLSRAMARRAAMPPGPKAVGPLRVGAPPGHRRRETHEIDGILMECDLLARRAAAPDTS